MEASALTTASHSGLLARRSPLLRLQSDERLVALIRDGHDRAFEVLFDRYQVRLLGFCRHMVRSAPDAEDLLQEVFVAAHAAMLADDRPINARPWLYRIARNRCLNHLRRPVADGQDTMDVHPHANGTTTFERVQKREELRTIVADVQDLPETQRTALVLREIDGLSYTEIAQTMGVTLASVKSLLVRSRMALAEASEARILACDDVRLELAEAAEGIGKISGAARRHVKECRSCKRFRGELRSTSRSIATLAPFGLFAVVGKFVGSMFGGGGSAGSASGSAGAGAGAAGSGAAGAGAAGSVGAAGSLGGAAAAAGGSGITLGGALGTVGGVVGAKAAVGVATAALITAGAVGAKKFSEEPQPAPSKPVAAAPAHPTKEWSVEHSRAEVATVVAKPAPAVTAAAVPTEAPAAEPAPPQAPPVTTGATPATDTAPAPNPATEPVEAATGTAVDDTGGTGATDDGTTDDGIAGGSSNENDDDTGEDPDPDPPPVVVPPPPDSDLAPPPTDPPPLTE